MFINAEKAMNEKKDDETVSTEESAATDNDSFFQRVTVKTVKTELPQNATKAEHYDVILPAIRAAFEPTTFDESTISILPIKGKELPTTQDGHKVSKEQLFNYLDDLHVTQSGRVQATLSLSSAEPLKEHFKWLGPSFKEKGMTAHGQDVYSPRTSHAVKVHFKDKRCSDDEDAKAVKEHMNKQLPPGSPERQCRATKNWYGGNSMSMIVVLKPHHKQFDNQHMTC